MIRPRSIPLALDYAFGMSMEQLAQREKISVQRVQQLLSGMSFQLFASTHSPMLRSNPARTAELIKIHVTQIPPRARGNDT